MGLRLHNTLTRTKQDFVPIDANNVRMYVCGPTVYDFAHIGNARPLIVFDVLYRLLQYLAKKGEWDGGKGETKVTYVRNITDVDDKINARAAEQYPDLPLNDAIRAVTEKTEAQFHADVDALGCLPPTHEPRATEYIERAAAPTDMIRLIADLIARKHAYVAEGHVLFDVPSMPDYGKLSNRSLDDMIAGARVEVAPYKKDPMDFVLWKPSKPGEPAWPSPWSNGRPGWHIECSAMAGALLGDTFDIHGGGIDLIFPHHENEIAQSRCAHGTSVMANYWLHNGFLQVEGEKMSKSLGNFVTIHELLAMERFGGRRWKGSTLRVAMLRTNYRQPIDWTVESLISAEQSLNKWRDFAGERTTTRANKERFKQFEEALVDDLNTPAALTILDETASMSNPQPHDRRFVFEALRLIGLKSSFTNSRKAADALIKATKIIARMDLAEVQRVIEIANLRPVNRSGKLRSETKLVLALDQLDGLVRRRQLKMQMGHDDLSLAFAAQIHASDNSEDERRAEIDRLIEARAAARKAKNFAEADRIRGDLDAMGIALKDAKDPKTGELVTTWDVKR
jgi:cysteinyl-tRNA synthetase